MFSPALLIFDCDGVLVDSERLSHAVLQEMLAEHGVVLSLQATLDHFMGSSTEGMLATLASLINAPPPADFLAHFRGRSFESFKTSLAPVPGIAELMLTLNRPFCVASNGPHEKMRMTLGHTGLLPYFEGRLFSAEDVRRPKPAPDLFLHAARALDAAPRDCLVIEDSPTGVAAAKAAGMKVAGYAAMGQGRKLSEAGADILFENMASLPQLLSKEPAP